MIGGNPPDDCAARNQDEREAESARRAAVQALVRDLAGELDSGESAGDDMIDGNPPEDSGTGRQEAP